MYSTWRYYSRMLEVDQEVAKYFRYFEGPGIGYYDRPVGTYYLFDIL